ncbi:hypothetical protein R5R35_013505 [Gryllus longicercus]|uniref:Carboxylic ester hydrolase n=2 Tax=Gryllus longicercus TaxID=2509291 RepID=A0AAN9V2J8_9ORTH
MFAGCGCGCLPLAHTARTTAMAEDEEQEVVVVRVAQGALKGRRVPFRAGKGRAFFSFRGVPYARPPIGPLRFQVAQPPDPWDGVREALEDGPPCPQVEKIFKVPYRGDEDCLYLNVYTPKAPNQGEELKIPVMVWIHGGAFENGSAEMDMYGPEYLVGAGVVIVCINYRLGVLGFLSLEDGSHSENLGLKDQVAALRWVKDNIAYFGGDPNNVTIFGESAGGASVNYHMLSPMSRGLFHKAIMQSGCALNPWATATKPRELAFALAKDLGCYATSSEDVLNFLRNISARQLIDTYDKIKKQQSGMRRWRFGPVPETNARPNDQIFLPTSPKALLENGNFHSVPCIIGITSQEGIISLQVNGILKNPALLRNIDDRLDPLIPQDVGVDNNQCIIREKIKEFYFGNSSNGESAMVQYVNYASDVHFTRGIDRTVNLLAANATPVFYYHFSFSGKMNIFKNWAQATKLTGAAHLDDVGYLFTSKFFNVPEVNSGSSEWITRERMVKLWTNFAKTGNPTPAPENNLNIYWPCLSSTKKVFLDINTKLSIGRDLYKERVEFWNNL